MGIFLLSTSSMPEQSSTVASVQAQGQVAEPVSLERLETDIQTLLQQALKTQATIEQLESQPSSHLWGADPSWVVGAQGVALGLLAIAFGGAVGWLASRRPKARLPLPAPDLADSRFYLDDLVPASMAGGVATAPATADFNVPAAPFSPIASTISDFAESAPMAESESVLDLFWGNSDPVTTPELEQKDPAAASIHAPREESSPFAQPVVSMEFDPQVAASEVERVRKFLAEKRDARTRQRIHDSHFGQNGQVAPVLAPTDADASSALDFFLPDAEISSAPGSVDLELDLDLSIDVDSVSSVVSPGHASIALVAGQEGLTDWGLADADPEPPETLPPAEPFDELPFSYAASEMQAEHTSAHANEVEVTDLKEPDRAVQLELAQQFEELGLLDGARELVLEVLASSHAPLHLQAQTMLEQLDAKETAQRVGDLVESQSESISGFAQSNPA